MGKTGVRGTFAALVATVLCGCRSEPDFVTVDRTMLGTTLHVVADVKGVSRQRLYAAVMELDREAKASMSIYDSTSLVSRLNRNETDSVDRHIAFNLHLADSIGALSDGRYDVTVKPLVEAWGFAGRERVENPDVDSIPRIRGPRKGPCRGRAAGEGRSARAAGLQLRGERLLRSICWRTGRNTGLKTTSSTSAARSATGDSTGRARRGIGVETPFDGNMSDSEYLRNGFR